MIGSKSNSSIRPVALGSALPASIYGAAIPSIYGRTKVSPYLIWAANQRHGGSDKTAKKVLTLGISSLFQTQGYIENVDYLIGNNPILTTLQFWINQTQKLPLNFVVYSVGNSGGGLGTGNASVTIPDGNFYAVIGITGVADYDVTFNDYGGQGSVHLTGSFEVPLWNMAQVGPNPINESAYRYGLYGSYLWTPEYGSTVYFPTGPFNQFCPTPLKIYYAQLDPDGCNLYDKKHSGTAIPVAALRLTFEPELGNDSEYVGHDQQGNDLTAQQIIYPHYAGMGSPNLDLGTGTAPPDIRPEILGSYPVYATGDADFADMVEDIFYGVGQAGWSNTTPHTPIQHGLNCYQYPGCVQKLVANTADVLMTGLQYARPNTAGNFLICAFQSQGGTLTISDTAGNTWFPLFGGSPSGYQVWYAVAVAATNNVVTVAGHTGGLAQSQIAIFEIAGVDMLDTTAAVVANNASITTSGGSFAQPEYVVAISMYTNIPNAYGTTNPNTLWPILLQAQRGAPLGTFPIGTVTDALFQAQQRVLYKPGTYNFKSPAFNSGATSNTGATYVALLAFKCSQPPNYPAPLGNIIGDIIDQPSMDVVRAQCRAAGLYGSFLVDTAQKGSEILQQLYDAMDAWPVWSGFTLKSRARSEISAVGNGATYTADTASGPVADLVSSDFISQEGESGPPVTVERKAQVNLPNLLQLQHPNRASDYNDVTLSQPETGSIALYGIRKDDPKRFPMFQDPSVGRIMLGILVRMQNYLRNVYKFTMNAKWKLLEAGDLITIPFSSTMPNPSDTLPYIKIPIRITQIVEGKDFSLQVEAEPFVYGCYAPVPLAATGYAGVPTQLGQDPGSVNTPVMFEPVARLEGQSSQGEIWLVASGAAAGYGGSQVYVSTNGPSGSYQNVGAIIGNAITGVSTSDWPADTDPDTTNDLPLDLTESTGILPNYSVADEDNFVYPCYVGGGGQGALVQSAGGTSFHGNSGAAVFSANTVAGNALLVTVGIWGTVGTVTVTDTQGNTFTKICDTPLAGNSKSYTFLALSTVGGADTITVHTTSSSCDFNVGIHELKGIAAVDAFAVNSGTGFYSGFTQTPGVVTPTQLDDLLISFWYDQSNNNTTITTPVGWTSALRVNNSPGAECLQVYDLGNAPLLPETVTFAATFPTGGTTNGFHSTILALKGAFAPVGSIPYELMTYAVANLTATSKYTLKATGTGNHLRRAVFGAPLVGQGVDHPSGSRFAFVGPPYPGILKLQMDPLWVGQTLYFKFCAFNQFLGNIQSLSDATAYPYTPTGVSSGSNPNTLGYSQTPSLALSNPSATTVHMAQVTEVFPSNPVNYNARSFTIPAPSVPTTYYVTINDPGYLGDTGASTNLTATCQTSKALVGLAGQVYIGSIVALPGGGGTTIGPGGWPQTTAPSGTAGGNAISETPVGTIDNINAIFTLTYVPNPASSLALFLNGVEQVLGTDYTISGLTITMTSAPQTTDDGFTAYYSH